MEQRDLFISHMDDLAGEAGKSGVALSSFLTPAQARDVGVHFAKRRDIRLSFDGGFEGAERTRAVFVNPDWGDYKQADHFAALLVEWSPRDTLGHRDILGAVMALGIRRHTIGDIIVEENQAKLICVADMSRYIAENLTKAGRVGVDVTAIPLNEVSEITETLRIKTDTVASLRLDSVLSCAFGLSRSKATELIAAGKVNLDYQQCLQPAKELKEGALLSSRCLGRARLLEIGGASKKGRLFVKIGVYGR